MSDTEDEIPKKINKKPPSKMTDEELKRYNCEKSKRYRERLAEKNSKLNIDRTKIQIKCAGPCKQIKFLTEFKRDKYGPNGGFDTECKDCVKGAIIKRKEKFKDIDPETTTKKCKGPCEKTMFLVDFNKHPGGDFCYNDICKECRKLERREKINTDPLTEGKKFCPGCEETYDVSKFSISKYSQKDGLQTYCKICHTKKVNESRSNLESYITSIVNYSKTRCSKQAKINRKILFDITKNDVLKLYDLQDGLCALTYQKMTHNAVNDRTLESTHIMNPLNISIDRIDSSKGYTVDNIRLVAADVNRIRLDINDTNLQVICRDIVRHTNYLTIQKKSLNYGFLPEKYTKKILPGLEKFIHTKILESRGNAKKRKISFDIDEDDVLDKFIEQNGKCNLSGQILTFSREDHTIDTNLSIDRIDSNKDYTLDNIQLVCGIINRMKSDFSNEKFIMYCNEINYGIQLNFLKMITSKRAKN